jgi:hypothetical protein
MMSASTQDTLQHIDKHIHWQYAQEIIAFLSARQQTPDANTCFLRPKEEGAYQS